jgi:hypothetical protein
MPSARVARSDVPTKLLMRTVAANALIGVAAIITDAAKTAIFRICGEDISLFTVDLQILAFFRKDRTTRSIELHYDLLMFDQIRQ